MKGKDLFAGTIDLPAFEYNEFDVVVTVKRSGLSMKFLQKCQDLQTKGESEPLMGSLANVITKWNIIDLEPTKKVLYEIVDVDFITKLLETMTETLVGNAGKPKK